MRLEGDVPGAAAMIDPETNGDPSLDYYPVHYERAVLDMLRGHPAAALQRIDALAEFPITVAENRIAVNESAAIVEMWCGHHSRALDRLLTILGDCIRTDASAYVGDLLVLAARSAADLADAAPDRAGAHRHLAQLRDLRPGPTRTRWHRTPRFRRARPSRPVGSPKRSG